MSLVDVNRLDLEQITLPARNVEAYLSAFLRHRPLPENLKRAVEYGLLGGGKLVRPILVIRCCEAVGGRPEQALAPAGFPKEGRRFHPHLTIGRIRGAGPGRRELSRLIQQAAEFDAGKASVEEALVFSSRLGKSGPAYEVLGRAPLTG